MTKYNVREIDEMRELTRLDIKYNSYVKGWSQNYWRNGPDEKVVESRLMTYMQNGTKPREIKKELKKRIKKAKAEANRLESLDYNEAGLDIRTTIGDLEYSMRGIKERND